MLLLFFATSLDKCQFFRIFLRIPLNTGDFGLVLVHEVKKFGLVLRVVIIAEEALILELVTQSSKTGSIRPA